MWTEVLWTKAQEHFLLLNIFCLFLFSIPFDHYSKQEEKLKLSLHSAQNCPGPEEKRGFPCFPFSRLEVSLVPLTVTLLSAFRRSSCLLCRGERSLEEEVMSYRSLIPSRILHLKNAQYTSLEGRLQGLEVELPDFLFGEKSLNHAEHQFLSLWNGWRLE